MYDVGADGTALRRDELESPDEAMSALPAPT
jgi:hypothetical protein